MRYQDIIFEDYLRQFDKVPFLKRPILAIRGGSSPGSCRKRLANLRQWTTGAEVYHGAERLGEIAPSG